MKRALTILLLLASASVSPLIFPIAESGRGAMDVLAKLALLPSAALLLITVGALYRFDDRWRGLVPLAWRRAPLPRLPWKPSDCQVFGLVSCLEIFRDSWACFCSISSQPGRR